MQKILLSDWLFCFTHFDNDLENFGLIYDQNPSRGQTHVNCNSDQCPAHSKKKLFHAATFDDSSAQKKK